MNLRLKLKWLAVNVASALLTVSLVVLVTALAYPRIHDYVPIGPPPKGAAHLSMIFGSIASSFPPTLKRNDEMV